MMRRENCAMEDHFITQVTNPRNIGTSSILKDLLGS